MQQMNLVNNKQSDEGTIHAVTLSGDNIPERGRPEVGGDGMKEERERREREERRRREKEREKRERREREERRRDATKRQEKENEKKSKGEGRHVPFLWCGDNERCLHDFLS